MRKDSWEYQGENTWREYFGGLERFATVRRPSFEEMEEFNGLYTSQELNETIKGDTVSKYVAWRRSKYWRPFHNWVAAYSYHYRIFSPRNFLGRAAYRLIRWVEKLSAPEKTFYDLSTVEKIAAGLELSRHKASRQWRDWAEYNRG
jgi:hypothetical protein